MAADADSYAADYEYRTPLIIVTSKLPAKHPAEGNGVSIIFATNGVADAVAQAKEAAKGRDVTCGLVGNFGADGSAAGFHLLPISEVDHSVYPPGTEPFCLS